MFRTIEERLVVLENKVETLEEVCKDIRESLKDISDLQNIIQTKLEKIETKLDSEKEQQKFYFEVFKWLGIIILGGGFIERHFDFFIKFLN